jgi:hypothetical protein
VFGRSTFRKLVPLLAALVAASATLVAFRSAGGGGSCITAYRSPPINGKDATCQAGVTIGGVMLWNFEGLLYRSLGDLPALKKANQQSPDFVTGLQVCPRCTFYSYTFTNHTNSAFKLVTQGPKVPPDTTKERVVRIQGRYVLCDARRKWFLVWYPHTLNFGLDCSPA